MTDAHPPNVKPGFWQNPRTRRAGAAAAAVAVAAIVATAGFAASIILPSNDRHAGLLATQSPAVDHSSPTLSPSPAPVTALEPAPVTLSIERGEFAAWALAEIPTGDVLGGSTNSLATSTTESMVKAWIAADYLVRHDTISAHKRDQLRAMIRNSDNDAAEDLYGSGGYDLVIGRLIADCYLDNTYIHHNWWSLTQMAAVDAARLGACIGSGQAAGPEWTGFLLDEMRHVTGRVDEQTATKHGGRWGIIDGLPPGHDVAMKNGWTEYDGMWHVNCLAIVDNERSLAVMTRYPASKGLAYGAGLCASVARQLSTQNSPA